MDWKDLNTNLQNANFNLNLKKQIQRKLLIKKSPEVQR